VDPDVESDWVWTVEQWDEFRNSTIKVVENVFYANHQRR